MDLLPSPEQEEIVSTVRAQLAKDFDLNALADRDGADSVVDRDLWSRCAGLGWFGLGLDESLGGVGYSLTEEALLFAELGAHATPGPFLPTVLGARLAALAGEVDLAGGILGGDVHVALAQLDADGATLVSDHGGADVWLTFAGGSATLVDAGEVVPVPSLDPLVPLGTARIDGLDVRARLDDAAGLHLRGTVLVASELAGIATATAEQSTAYAQDREQFGRPIGSFQAVKHRCADMAVRAEAATSLVRYASLSDDPFHVHAARAVAADAALHNARTNVQNHGGIGFTWEHTAHRYVTRAEVRSRTLGSRTDHLAALLAAPAPEAG